MIGACFLDLKIRTTYYILLTETTAVLNEVALSYHEVRGQFFLPVVFAVTIYTRRQDSYN